MLRQSALVNSPFLAQPTRDGIQEAYERQEVEADARDSTTQSIHFPWCRMFSVARSSGKSKSRLVAYVDITQHAPRTLEKLLRILFL